MQTYFRKGLGLLPVDFHRSNWARSRYRGFTTGRYYTLAAIDPKDAKNPSRSHVTRRPRWLGEALDRNFFSFYTITALDFC